MREDQTYKCKDGISHIIWWEGVEDDFLCSSFATLPRKYRHLMNQRARVVCTTPFLFYLCGWLRVTRYLSAGHESPAKTNLLRTSLLWTPYDPFKARI